MCYINLVHACCLGHVGHRHEAIFRQWLEENVNCYSDYLPDQSESEDKDSRITDFESWTLDDWIREISNKNPLLPDEFIEHLNELLREEIREKGDCLMGVSYDCSGPGASGFDYVFEYAGITVRRGSDEYEECEYGGAEGWENTLQLDLYLDQGDTHTVYIDPIHAKGPYDRLIRPHLKAHEDKLYDHVDFLTSLNPARNYLNTESLNEAKDYIYWEFKRNGLIVSEQKWMADGREYTNVIGLYPGQKDSYDSKGKPLPKSTLVVGAHYDVAGDQPGADDNASAVAGLLETARLLHYHKPDLPYHVELVAYCLEEPPFFGTPEMGSYIHAQSLSQEKRPVKGMICYEMIGYFSDKPGSQALPDPQLRDIIPDTGHFIAVIGHPKYADFNQTVYDRMLQSDTVDVRALGLAGQPNPEILASMRSLSDHHNYWRFGIPALMINDTSMLRNPHYHRVTDTIDTLDFSKMAGVVDATFNAIINL